MRVLDFRMKDLPVSFILLVFILGVCIGQPGRMCDETLSMMCPFDRTGIRVPCFDRPLSETADPDDFNFVCDCTTVEDIANDCSERDLGHRDGGFITCYGNDCRTGFFESEAYPNIYPNQWEATYLLYIPGAARIDFRFSGSGGFGVESFQDGLYIGTGLFFSSDLISRSNSSLQVIDGITVRFFDNRTAGIIGLATENPPNEYPADFSLDTDTAWLYFLTNTNLRFNGWRLEWTAVVDELPPVIVNCPMDIQVSLQSGVENSVEVTWMEPFANDPSDPVTSEQTHVSGQRFLVGDGETTVTYIFSDRFGNQAVCSFRVIVTGVDTIPPVISGCPSDIEMTIEEGDPNPSITWEEPTATDSGGGGVTLALRSHQPGAEFPPGTTLVTYIFQDSASNTADCNFNVIIRTADTIPPVISWCPSDQTLTIELGEQGMNAFWVPPTATDNSGTASLVLESHTVGQTFAIGQTTVMYVFADPTGNQNTCEFRIRVVTGSSGIDFCPRSMLVTTCNQEEEVSWESPVFYNAGKEFTVESSHSPGSVFRLGETSVIYTFEDTQSGDVEVCSFRVTVTEQTNCSATPYAIYAAIGAGSLILFFLLVFGVVKILRYKRASVPTAVTQVASDQGMQMQTVTSADALDGDKKYASKIYTTDNSDGYETVN